MTEIKKNERYISTKNYIIAFGVVIGILLLVWYCFAWYKVYKEDKVSTSYLIKNNIISNEIKDLNEIVDVFSEAPDEYYVYVSYTGDEEIFAMEKELAKIIKKYNIADQFYYLNVTGIKDNSDYVNDINRALSLRNEKIIRIPTIIYYKDGEVVKDGIVSTKDNKMMTSADFQKILDKNNVKK